MMIIYLNSGAFLLLPEARSSSVSLHWSHSLTVGRADDLDSARVHPILPAKLYDSIAQFKLGNTNVDDIPLGLSPFMMCPTGYFRADGQTKTNTLYTMLNADGGTASLSDLQTLLKSSFNLPADLLQLIEFVGSYSVTIDVILGVQSPLAVALLSHYRFLFSNLNAVRSSISDTDLLPFMMRVLRFIQIISINYINAKLNLQLLNVGDPTFAPIESAIQNLLFHQFPTIPARYFSDMHSAAGKTKEPKTAPTPRAASTPAAASTAAPAPRARNTDRESAFLRSPPEDIVPGYLQAFVTGGKTIKVLRALPLETQPATSDKNSKICLSWHYKGFCYAGCMNKASHRSLDTAEATSFQAFTSAHL